MASYDLNKIVSASGDEYNVRDTTKQPVADRVTAWSSTPSDSKYPSEKLVKNSLDAKADDSSVFHNTDIIPVANGGTGRTSVPSGDYLVGNGTAAFGVMTPNEAANNLINALPEGTYEPVDATYFVSQHSIGGTMHTDYYRRPMSALWGYIQTKIASVLGLTVSNYGGTAASARNAYYMYTTKSGTAYWIKIGSVSVPALSVEAGVSFSALISSGYNHGDTSTKLSAQVVKLSIRSKGTSTNGVYLVCDNVTLGFRGEVMDGDVRLAVKEVSARTTTVNGVYDIYVEQKSWHRVFVTPLHQYGDFTRVYNSDTTIPIADTTGMTIFSPTLPYAMAVKDGNGNNIASTYATKAEAVTDVAYSANASGGGGTLNRTKNGSTTSVLSFMTTSEAHSLWTNAKTSAT